MQEGIRIAFVGDICVQSSPRRPMTRPPALDRAHAIVANLEGPIVSSESARAAVESRNLALFNSGDVLDVLEGFGVSAVSLANNHMFDIAQPLALTKDHLEERGIQDFGAGSDRRSATREAVFERGETRIRVVGFGWPVIGCRPVGERREGVNPWSAANALEIIRRIRATDRSSFVVYYVHWNYELEPYPQPADRQLARALIDEGVDAVIGLHPHVVGGAEIFRKRLIAYSLGNWFFPPARVGPLHLRFPPSTRMQLAVELCVRAQDLLDVRFHWFHFDPDEGGLEHLTTEGVDGAILRGLTPWEKAQENPSYARWFRKHRRRRRGLPVYANFLHSRRNRARDQWVQLRDKAIRALVQLGMKGGPRQ